MALARALFAGTILLLLFSCRLPPGQPPEPLQHTPSAPPRGYLDPRIQPPLFADQFSPETSAMLQEVSSLHARGYFLKAWNLYRAFFAHQDAPRVDPITLTNCFEGFIPCPHPGQLALFLGKSIHSVDGFDRFCPTWETPAFDGVPKTTARDTLDKLLVGVFEDTCADWRRRQALWAYSPQQAVSRALDPLSRGTTASFALVASGEHLGKTGAVEDTRPFLHFSAATTESQMAGLALVDTGSTLSRLPSPVFQTAFANSTRQLGVVNIAAFGGYRRDPVVRVPWIQIAAYRIPEVTALDSSDVENLIGQEVLMRAPAICFDLNARRLHLGKLATCANGTVIQSGFVTPSFLVHIEIQLPGGSVEAIVDTGSPVTLCSTDFIALNDGAREFTVAPELPQEAYCYEGDEFSPTFYEYGYQAILGMDHLLTYSTFGYKRAPLRIYFGQSHESGKAHERDH